MVYESVTVTGGQMHILSYLCLEFLIRNFPRERSEARMHKESILLFDNYRNSSIYGVPGNFEEIESCTFL